jgi:ADP-ribose pyrophosphatase YjhB (NUDIX family)
MIHGEFKFCPMCGHALENRLAELEHKERLVCPSCGFIDYDNPTPAAGVIVFVDDRLLLVKRKYMPKVGMWTLPAGFMESGEDAAECAVREAKEETNLDVEVIRLFGVYSAFDDPRAAVVLILYLCKKVGGTLECGDDASDGGFFELDHLPEDIAFRAHRHAIADIKKAFADGNL